MLFGLQEFLEKATDYERYKRMRGLRNPNNAHFDAAPPPPSRLNLELLDKEVRFFEKLDSCRFWFDIKFEVHGF